ncbi:unnamed protein product, partial [marine sediment metagenome]
MGLFRDIAGVAEKFGGRLRAAGEYVGERAAQPAGKWALGTPPVEKLLAGLGEYHTRVVLPNVFRIKMAMEHPEVLWDPEEKRRRLRAAGIRDPGKYDEKFFWRAISGDKETREAMERDVSELPTWQRVGLEIGADPLTYAIGVRVA